MAKRVMGKKKEVAMSQPSCSLENKMKIIDEYFKNGMVMYKAVQAVFPNYTAGSASTLGSFIKKEFAEEIEARKQEMLDNWIGGYVLTAEQRQKLLSKLALMPSTKPGEVNAIVRTLNDMEGLGSTTIIANVNSGMTREERRQIAHDEFAKMFNPEDVVDVEVEDDSTGQSS